MRIVHSVAAIALFARTTATAQSLSPSTPPLLTLKDTIVREIGPNETHSYQFQATAGYRISGAVEQRGVDLVVTLYSPSGKSLSTIDSPNGDQGDEPFSILADTSGLYKIEVKTLDQSAKPGKYAARLIEVLSPEAIQAERREFAQRAAGIASWIKSSAIPLRTVVAGGSTTDLQPLKKTFQNVRLVGLGEATHGTREFFQAKHRLVEFLVKEMGFRIFAIEASQAASEVINDYVMGKTSDGAAALAGQGFWTWDTEEVRDMLNWMRSYNASVPADRKVRFAGYDLQANQRSGELLTRYLEKYAPEWGTRIKSLPPPTRTRMIDSTSMENLSRIATEGPQDRRADAKLRFDQTRAAYFELLGFLTLNELDLIRRSSASEFSSALRYARLITQLLEAYAPDGRSSRRDELMADNIIRILNEAPPNTRIVLWAHNGHIERNEPTGSWSSMGNILASVYSDAYYALGFAFNQGSFQARSLKPDAGMALTSFTVGPSSERSFDWQLAQAGIPLFIIDFRKKPADRVTADWLSGLHSTRSIGAVFMNDDRPATISPARQFDGILFVDRTTRARPNPGVPNVAKEKSNE